MMEALQMLKFSLRKERLDFTTGWETSEKQMKEDEMEEDILERLVRTGYPSDLQEQIEFVMRAVNEYED